MKVTDINLPMDPRLKYKLDLCCQRCSDGRDSLLIVEGYEGFGKSSLAGSVCYYAAWKLKRKLTVDNVFFEIDDMIKYASTTERQIIWWDEAALGGLGREWQNKMQIKLLKLLMIARKKSHFFVFCIPRFHRLNEGIIDRAIGMLRVYSRNELEVGRFAYYRKKQLYAMYQKWKTSKKVQHNIYYSFLSSFPDAIHKYNVIDPVGYEAKKDIAIANLTKDDKETVGRDKASLIKMRYMIANTDKYTDKEKSEILGVTREYVNRWRRLNQEYPQIVGASPYGSGIRNVNNNLGIEKNKLAPVQA